jgi:ATP-binding cassette subfamily B protein
MLVTAGEAVTGPPARSSTGKAYDHGRRWLRRLAGDCWRHPWLVVLAFGGALLATLGTLVIPLIQRNVLDNAILSRHQPVWPGAAELIGAALVTYAGAYVRRSYGARLCLKVQHVLRTEMFGALMQLDGAGQDQLDTGQIVSRATSDLDTIRGALANMPMMMGSLILFVLSIVVMAFLSPLLTIVALTVGPVLLLISVVSRRTLFPANWAAQQEAAGVAGVVNDAVTGIRVVKGFGQEEQEIQRLERASERLYAARVRTVRLVARYGSALQAVPVIGQVGVLALGGWLASRGSISIGTFLAFSAYVTQMAGPVRFLSDLIVTGQQARASAIRVYEVIDSRPVITEKPGAVKLPAGTPDVELDNVHFGYVPSQPVLRGLSLWIPAGQAVAVVGTSGSGKSTLSLLLPRFYDADAGAVRIGGHDARELTLDSLRASIGLVMEENFLFSDTVRANIAYGRPDATREQIVASARAAEADEFITELPDGYDTVVGEQGLTLSGGQRQRVALARALITDPAILILDDATSAVDARVEAQIYATLRKVMTGRTTLLIAHRRSTLQLADQIAVLDEGQLADLGSHEELTARCPLYRLLLSGPGEDAEGLDAGEVAYYEAGGRGQAADLAVQPSVGVTPGLWTAAAAGTAVGEAGTAATAIWPAAGKASSPELLAQVAALPPATDTPDVDPSYARVPDPRFTLRRLLRPFAVALVIGLVLDGLDALAGVAMPWLVRGGIDSGIEHRKFSTVVVISIAALAIALASWLVNAAQTIVVGRHGERLLYTLRVKIFAHLQRLGLDFYEHELTGRILTRMTTDVDSLSSFLQTGLITMVNSTLTFVGVLIALVFINARLALTLFAILPLLAAATLVFRAKSRRAYAEAREKVSAVNADLRENVAGLRVAQAYRRQQVSQDRFSGLSGAFLASRVRAQRYIALYFPFVQALSTIAGALVLLAAASEVRSGVLTTGGLVAYLLYIDSLFSPVQQLSQVFDGYQQANVSLQRIKGLLRTPATTPPPARPVLPARLRGAIELDDVHFRYAQQAAEAISGVSLRIDAGETVALVGQTGAGKSTLVKLVARFYDVTSGSVRIDGIDVRDLDPQSYRQQLGVVPQEPYLFTGTIRDAIAYGRPGATDAEVEAAARGVGAIEMISRLPGGFRHAVAERGRNLSAGQRQLVALARAYLVAPAILLLDEATAALDLAAEAEVTRATEQLAARRTTLVVAHRLTTAARADRIVVMSGGRIAEIGTHARLLELGGSYAALWAAFADDAEAVA